MGEVASLSKRKAWLVDITITSATEAPFTLTFKICEQGCPEWPQAGGWIQQRPIYPDENITKRSSRDRR